ILQPQAKLLAKSAPTSSSGNLFVELSQKILRFQICIRDSSSPPVNNCKKNTHPGNSFVQLWVFKFVRYFVSKPQNAGCVLW
ncbi:MAG: hypothetical protein IJB95_04510, partial [Clostridia bacterium]|nr:hypothetical protein [Clostridia bacterium]